MSQQIEFDFVLEESARVLGNMEERQIEAVVQLMAQIIVSVWESGSAFPTPQVPMSQTSAGKEENHAE